MMAVQSLGAHDSKNIQDRSHDFVSASIVFCVFFTSSFIKYEQEQ